MKSRQDKQEEAKVRELNRSKRTEKQQLEILNSRLGINVGARRERERLSQG